MNYKVNNKEGGILEALKQAYDEHIDFIKSRKKKGLQHYRQWVNIQSQKSRVG